MRMTITAGTTNSCRMNRALGGSTGGRLWSEGDGLSGEFALSEEFTGWAMRHSPRVRGKKRRRDWHRKGDAVAWRLAGTRVLFRV